MANLKYPGAMKNKAILAWLSAIVMGFTPMLYFYPTYLAKEHYSGNNSRKTYGEPK